ncbi:MAG: polymorphic toxin type 30 domain-containing protein [Candidatus Sericytochromatia bacterium]
MCVSSINTVKIQDTKIFTPVKVDTIKSTVSVKKIEPEIQTKDSSKTENILKGTAKYNVAFVSEPKLIQKLSASTQTLLKSSSSNDTKISLGLTVGGAVAGTIAAKVLGKKALPLALLGSSIGSLTDRAIGIVKNTDKISGSYKTGKTDATKLEVALGGIGFALDISGVAGANKLLKMAEKTSNISTKIISNSTEPISEGFRQYKKAENLVGKAAGEAWEHSITKGIPSPNQLAKFKGTADVTGAEAFLNKADNIKLQGSSIKDIVSKVPKEAQLRELTPSKTIKEGFEYAWVDKKTGMDYRLRVHGADSGVALHNPTSTAAQGWIFRIERNPVGQREFSKIQALMIDGEYKSTSHLIELEKAKKEAELTLAVIKDAKISSVGQISEATSSATVSAPSLLKGALMNTQEAISTGIKTNLAHQIEEFHHGVHIAVGDGLNKAVK